MKARKNMSEKGKGPAERMVALIRGINVGPAKWVPMAELRALVEDLGCRDVRVCASRIEYFGSCSADFGRYAILDGMASSARR